MVVLLCPCVYQNVFLVQEYPLALTYHEIVISNLSCIYCRSVIGLTYNHNNKQNFLGLTGGIIMSQVLHVQYLESWNWSGWSKYFKMVKFLTDFSLSVFFIIIYLEDITIYKLFTVCFPHRLHISVSKLEVKF